MELDCFARCAMGGVRATGSFPEAAHLPSYKKASAKLLKLQAESQNFFSPAIILDYNICARGVSGLLLFWKQRVCVFLTRENKISQLYDASEGAKI